MSYSDCQKYTWKSCGFSFLMLWHTAKRCLKQGLIIFPYRYNLKCFYPYFLTIITKLSCIHLKCLSDLSCVDNYTAGTCACYYRSVACECEAAMNGRRNVWNYQKLRGKQL